MGSACSFLLLSYKNSLFTDVIVPSKVTDVFDLFDTTTPELETHLSFVKAVGIIWCGPLGMSNSYRVSSNLILLNVSTAEPAARGFSSAGHTPGCCHEPCALEKAVFLRLSCFSSFCLSQVELEQEKGLEMRKWVLSGILASEETYLSQLEALLIVRQHTHTYSANV